MRKRPVKSPTAIRLEMASLKVEDVTEEDAGSSAVETCVGRRALDGAGEMKRQSQVPRQIAVSIVPWSDGSCNEDIESSRRGQVDQDLVQDTLCWEVARVPGSSVSKTLPPFGIEKECVERPAEMRGRRETEEMTKGRSLSKESRSPGGSKSASSQLRNDYSPEEAFDDILNRQQKILKFKYIF